MINKYPVLSLLPSEALITLVGVIVCKVKIFYINHRKGVKIKDH